MHWLFVPPWFFLLNSKERTKAAQTTNALPQGTKSPVGSQQNKLPSIKGKK